MINSVKGQTNIAFSDCRINRDRNTDGVLFHSDCILDKAHLSSHGENEFHVLLPYLRRIHHPYDDGYEN